MIIRRHLRVLRVLRCLHCPLLHYHQLSTRRVMRVAMERSFPHRTIRTAGTLETVFRFQDLPRHLRKLHLWSSPSTRQERLMTRYVTDTYVWLLHSIHLCCFNYWRFSSWSLLKKFEQDSDFDVLADEYKKLPREEKEQWEAEARKDKVRYHTEKNNHNGPWQVPKRRARKHPLAPRRP